MKLKSVVLVELQQSQYAQSILKKRASSGIVHHVGKYDIVRQARFDRKRNRSNNPNLRRRAHFVKQQLHFFTFCIHNSNTRVIPSAVRLSWAVEACRPTLANVIPVGVSTMTGTDSREKVKPPASTSHMTADGRTDGTST